MTTLTYKITADQIKSDLKNQNQVYDFFFLQTDIDDIKQFFLYEKFVNSYGNKYHYKLIDTFLDYSVSDAYFIMNFDVFLIFNMYELN